MKISYIITILFWAMTSNLVQAQNIRIHTDIFGDLQYRNTHDGLEASLKKDIFDDLIYSDNRNNQLTFEKKYLQSYQPNVLRNSVAKTAFFQSLIRENWRKKDYQAKYKIDIFDQLIIEDNQGMKIKEGKDIFGHNAWEMTVDGDTRSIKRSLDGTLNFSSKGQDASLAKNFHGTWVYKDSSGNTFEFGGNTWRQLIADFGNDEAVFDYLLRQYLLLQ